MWKKNNPEGGSGQNEKTGPTKRDTSSLMGVKASTPTHAESNRSADTVQGGAFSIADIESVPSPQGRAGFSGNNDPVGTVVPPREGGAADYSHLAQKSESSPTEKAADGTKPVAVKTWSPAASNGGGKPPSGSATPGAPSGDGQWNRLTEFRGKGGELFWLYLVNMLLSIITLGIYSFWGKTKIRQYLWNKTQLLSHPLEYTGTGKELFISFLIALPCIFFGALALQLILPIFPLLGVIIIYPLVLFLWQWASYSALRYRLTRTRWRGIRGNLSGSGVSYGFKAMLYLLLGFCTFGLAIPWVTSRLTSMQLNNVWFGNRRMSFSGPAKELYKSFFTMLGLSFLVMIGFGLAMSTLMQSVVYAGRMQEGTAFMIILLYFVLMLALLLISSYFMAAYTRWIFAHMVFGKVRSRSRITGRRLLSLHLSNFFLVVFTLGLGAAWATIRGYHLYLNCIDYAGDFELNSLLQDTQPIGAAGEGLLDALDMDIGF